MVRIIHEGFAHAVVLFITPLYAFLLQNCFLKMFVMVLIPPGVPKCFPLYLKTPVHMM